MRETTVGSFLMVKILAAIVLSTTAVHMYDCEGEWLGLL